MVACILLVVGGLNWGLVGLGGLLGGKDLNVVHLILGSIPTLEYIVYLLVAVSAVVHGMCCMKGCESCEKKM